MKKIKVSDACIGCGACVSIANEYFDFNDEGYSCPKKEVIEDKDIDIVTEAKEACPVEAIDIVDEEKAA